MGWLNDGIGLLRQRPRALAIGVMGILLIPTLACGVGWIAFPWLSGKLIVELRKVAERPPTPAPRSLAAGALFWGLALVLLGITVFITLGLGTHVPILRQAAPRVLTAGFGAAIGWHYVSPVVFAPWILLDRGSVAGAIEESVQRTSPSTMAFRLSVGALAGLWGAALASIGTAEPTSVWELVMMLLALLGSVAIPIWASAIVTVAHARTTGGMETEVTLAAPADRRGALRRSGQDRLLMWLFPVAALLLSSLSAGRSSRARFGPPPSFDEADAVSVGEHRRFGDGAATAPCGVPEIAVRVDRHRVVVETADGGGVGAIPLRGSVVRRAVVTPIPSGYAIAIDTASASSEHITVDACGIRRDDDLYARFADRVPPWLLCLIGGLFLMTPIVLGRRSRWYAALIPLLAAAGAAFSWIS